jgi:hypothetical protein
MRPSFNAKLCAFLSACLLHLLTCTAHCAPVPFGQVVALALHRKVGEQPAARSTDQQAGPRLCPVPLQNFAALAAKLDSANEMGIPARGRDFVPPSMEISSSPFAVWSRHDLLLCTVLVYAKLEDLEARQRLVRKQEELARRLMDIESRRVSAEVDHPLELTLAKMYRARTRMESASLDSSKRATEAGLGSLLGDAADSPSVAENSMPSLPERTLTTDENRQVLERLLAFRDLVQLDYVTAYMNRLKATHDMALARASVGVFVAAEIEEVMKLGALIGFNNQVRLAKIQFSGASGDLEAWALGRAHGEAGASGASVENRMPEPMGDETTPPAPVQSARLISLLIAPAIAELPIGKNQQYSVIATDSDGHARDVSAEATWSCSTDSGAVLSSTGLLTALSEGRLTIRVEFHGLTTNRELSITPQLPDESAAP